MDDKKAKLQMIIATCAFGSVGIFIHYIPFASSVIAMVRGLVGAAFLLVLIMNGKHGFDSDGVKKNLIKLVITGAGIGFNWILLFESYKYTSVARATLYYYIAPVFLIIYGSIFLKEKLSVKQVLCSLAAIAGIVLVSGVFENKGEGIQVKGLALGLGAAVLYSLVMFTNKVIVGIRAYDKTMIQVGCAGFVMMIYSFCTGAFDKSEFSVLGLVLALILGVFHTGFCYSLFFGSMEKLSTQSTAILTYIDPVVAVILSAVVLREHMSLMTAIGAALVIGALIVMNIEKGNK